MRRKSKEECALIGSWTIEAPLRHHFKSHQVKLKYTPPINICCINLSKNYFHLDYQITWNCTVLYQVNGLKKSMLIQRDEKFKWTRNSRPLGVYAFRRILMCKSHMEFSYCRSQVVPGYGIWSWVRVSDRWFERQFYISTVNFLFSAALDFVGINAYLYTDVTVWCHRLEVQTLRHEIIKEKF